MAKTYASYKPNTGWEERQHADAYEGVGKKSAAENNKQFRAACEKKGKEPTPRQYAKWANKTHSWRKHI